MGSSRFSKFFHDEIDGDPVVYATEPPTQVLSPSVVERDFEAMNKELINSVFESLEKQDSVRESKRSVKILKERGSTFNKEEQQPKVRKETFP
jgi:hypothetical protein